MFSLSVRNIVTRYLKHKYISGISNISEKDLSSILSEIRVSLLNADVNVEVIKAFFDEIKNELLIKKNYPRDQKLEVIVFSTIKKKLIEILGVDRKELNYSKSGINKFLLVGLNGSGKTTTTAKLSFHFKNNLQFSVRNVSLDFYRPGAFDQLKQLSDPEEISCFKIDKSDFKKGIKDQIIRSESEKIGCLFFDNYGLLRDNKKLLEETLEIKKAINPNEVLLVVDAMSGQDILESARIFHEKLGITGIIVSKTDSKAPMGGVFSISYMLKIPIKYMGTGEHISNLSPFYPDRIASLILGEGDILSLSEKIEKTIDEDVSKKFMSRFMNGHFDLNDLIFQIKEVRKMGSLKGLLKFLPNNPQLSNLSLDNAEHQLKIWEILISSMTMQERKNPKLFKKQPNRKIRVIKGSGRKPDEFNKLLKKWEEAKTKMDEILSFLKRGQKPMSFLFGKR